MGAMTLSAIPASEQAPSHIAIHVPPDAYIPAMTGAARTTPLISLAARALPATHVATAHPAFFICVADITYIGYIKH
jgi:hypothetical protein